ncbi:MAG TPA: DEAD/DEAH box helicase [Acetobacteraceae bacterium]|nr:DEAD/DEAH box helicase [Acetobacteraceae bacterium]
MSSNFVGLGLAGSLLAALDRQGFHTPTPIQSGAIPALLSGRDLLGVAQTGSGKTAAFGLPLLQHLATTPSRPQPQSTTALILAPTRELALQIEETLRTLGAGQRFRLTAILGGCSRHAQVQRMRPGVDIVVGTPGRICDLLSTGELKLHLVRHFVLDEADRMLDLGFIRDIRRIVAALPAARQSALFSATMPTEVAKLAEGLLRDPVRVAIAQAPATIPKIEQLVHFVDTAGKRALLGRLLDDPAMERVIVFTRTKHGADRVALALETGGVAVSALHGNKSQPQRVRALDQFRSGRARVLVATDIAARGIDVVGVSHVINFDLPMQAEDYVHRIGRTARAGASGIAISLCDASERSVLRAIERMTGTAIGVAPGSPPAPARSAANDAAPPPRAARNRRRGGMRRAA